MSEPQTRSVQQLMDLSGRTALVTGGSRGLGLQMAQALGEAGARLVISSRKANELEEAAEQLRAAGIDVTPLAVDLADEDAVMGLADRALEVLGRVDILVNNAGASWGAPAEDYPLEGWDKVMTLNVRNLFDSTDQTCSAGNCYWDEGMNATLALRYRF